MISLDPKTTALVLIDLQNFIVARPMAPHSAADVVARSKNLAEAFRAAAAPVVLVQVAFSKDGADAPPKNVDEPMQFRAGGFPPGALDLAEGLAAPGDLHVTKRQWGAFYGTELELQLRRRGVKTIVLAGIATNFGVESTARQAWELGFDLVVAEDACATSLSAETHAMAVTKVFPRISRVVASADIALAGA
jgi:nicotinamidase-related amidase